MPGQKKGDVMKEILPNVFAVEVPDKISDPHLYRVNENAIMLKWNDVKHPMNPHDIIRVDRYYGDLKDYKWPEILFTTKDCTEQQAMKVVAWDMYEDVGILAANYMDDRTGDKKTCNESLQSLLRYHGLSTDKNYLLLRKTS